MSGDTKPRVILIDDDESIRIWLKGLLVALGCEIAGEADNGRDGVDLVVVDAGLDDRAILDLAMVVGYYAYVNRLADGLGVRLEPGGPPDGSS